MDAYERSLKQQADRIKRELSREGQTTPPPPKMGISDEFIPSDVPSPIYGYARPKPKIVLPVEHSPETRGTLESEVASPLESIEGDQTEFDSNSEVDQVHSEEISRETVLEEKSILGQVSIMDDGFSSVFMQSTDFSRSKQEKVVEVHQEAVPHDNLDIDGSIEQIGESIEQIAEKLQTPSEQQELAADTDLTPAIEVSFKADQPPVNVMMTPKDRMAMYRSRRLAQKNNNL